MLVDTPLGTPTLHIRVGIIYKKKKKKNQMDPNIPLLQSKKIYYLRFPSNRLDGIRDSPAGSQGHVSWWVRFPIAMFLAHARAAGAHSLAVWLLGYFLIVMHIAQWRRDCTITPVRMRLSLLLSIYLILPAALGPRVYSLLGGRTRPVREAGYLNAIYEPIGYWSHGLLWR
jgi:hypothetical protein